MPATHEEGIASYYFEVLGKPEAYRKGSGKAAIAPNSNFQFQILNSKFQNSNFQILNSNSETTDAPTRS
jgi:hypothetical protein